MDRRRHRPDEVEAVEQEVDRHRVAQHAQSVAGDRRIAEHDALVVACRPEEAGNTRILGHQHDRAFESLTAEHRLLLHEAARVRRIGPGLRHAPEVHHAEQEPGATHLRRFPGRGREPVHRFLVAWRHAVERLVERNFAGRRVAAGRRHPGRIVDAVAAAGREDESAHREGRRCRHARDLSPFPAPSAISRSSCPRRIPIGPTSSSTG